MSDLKVDDLAELEFKPKELVHNICSIYANLGLLIVIYSCFKFKISLLFLNTIFSLLFYKVFFFSKIFE